jgi:predicted CXXCH cytochrome family protein
MQKARGKVTRIAKPTRRAGWGVACIAMALLAWQFAQRDESDRESQSRKLDPAAWGSDHVGKPRPEFVSGDECLFCHRDIGKSWPTNRHQTTVRPADTAPEAVKALAASAANKKLASEVEFVLGRENRVRYLKPSDQYGKLLMLTASWSPPAKRREGKLLDEQNSQWDGDTFGKSCAGCHATAVDAQTHAFSAMSLDCCVCHGDVPLEHSTETSLAHLSKKSNDEARVVVSICGQCHIRTGKSKSLGTPYPNNFVAGDNLFRDFQIDWSDEHLKSLNPAERHVLENIRDVAVFGKSEITCLSCHDVHGQSDKKHQTLPRGNLCNNCHDPDNLKKIKRYEAHSKTCEY